MITSPLIFSLVKKKKKKKKEMESQFKYKCQSPSHDDLKAKILKLQLSPFLGVILHLCTLE